MKTKIFVTVGSTFPLDRLIKQIEVLAKNKSLQVTAQIGDSKLKPQSIKWKNFFDHEAIQQEIDKADIVITHAGVGTILECMSKNKKLIIFPRLKKYAEAIDDHQLEICKAFNKKYGIPFILKEQNLKNILSKITITRVNKKNKKENDLCKSIRAEIYG